LAKLEQVLPSRLRRRVNTLHSFVVSAGPGKSAPRVEASVLTAITAAARDHERLRFDYADHSGAASRREVEPYRLVNRIRRWYLVAYDLDRDAWRTFRVDRLTPRIPTGPRFTPRELPAEDLAAYVTRGVGEAYRQVRARIVIHAPVEVIAERHTPLFGSLEAVDENTCVLESGANNPESLAHYLGTLDVDFTVTDPPELVERLRELADRYARAVPSTRAEPA
jgi:predicted DNA-binding transcriptional regulator YafY